MKKLFKHKEFNPAALEILHAVIEIVREYQKAGLTLSLRQAYYQLVAKNIVPNNLNSYKRVCSIIGDGRLAAMVPWDMIEDRNRETLRPSTWDDGAQILRACAHGFRMDHWVNQPNYMEVMVEKAALEGILSPVCNELYIPFTSNRGYSSDTMMFDTGQRLQREFARRMDFAGLDKRPFPGWVAVDDFDDEENRATYIQQIVKLAERGFVELNEDDDGKATAVHVTPDGIKRGIPRLVVIYLGDHDPSGIDMTRDVRDRLALFSDRTPMEVRRVALNMDQIKKYSPPENPAKETDSRSGGYIEKFGDKSWELDSLEPKALVALVRATFAELVHKKRWAEVEAKQEATKAKLLAFADTFKA